MVNKVLDTIEIVRNAFSEPSAFIPLHEPRFYGNEKKYVVDAIDSTFVSSVGAYVDKFELMLSDFVASRRAVAVVNGTSGIQVALKLIGVNSGDEVITQALTFVATANAIVYNGAIPVFIDVDKDTMGLSPEALKVFLDEFGDLRDDGCYNKKTGSRFAACLPMHTFGFPVRMDEILDICKKWNIPVVEDAAESLGSYYKGKHTGTLGEIGVFSFNGNKIITSGGGGAIVTNSELFGTQAKHLTTTAKQPHPYEYVHDQLGFNYRMPNLNAALLCAQMEMLTSFIEEKRLLASFYEKRFFEKGIRFRTEQENTRANYWLMCVELESRKDRDMFLKETNDNKVMSRPIWQLLFRSKIYSNCQRDSQVNASFLEDRIVNIPSSAKKY
jgi:perosamine synthetase